MRAAFAGLAIALLGLLGSQRSWADDLERTVPEGAAAREAPADRENRRKEPRTLKLEVLARAGYGASLTTGLSYLGVGQGLTVGVHLNPHWIVETSLTYFLGERVHAQNSERLIDQRSSSFQSGLALGYEFRAGAWGFRPRLDGAVTFVVESATVGDQKRSAVSWVPSIGPGFAARYDVGRVRLGADLSAFFAPTRVASPGAVFFLSCGTAF